MGLHSHIQRPNAKLKYSHDGAGPTRSGTYTASKATFPSMKKKPNNVTRFGASHNGNSSTKPFHCRAVREALAGWGIAYVVL
jgi:hypothetical protein